ncbi:MAG: keto-hydroxyglutarate-aldolase/keto-deoxy-phosphogluconate aldolase, partial [Spirochaetales bacterium]|nr:keto-hydroxyglutarate-aldolase/keto-deoxy-phosphogluconate aldolase [Spirochaetales bacterium]
MPILTISRPDSIRQVARILTEEDHPVIEITLRTEAAFEALSILRTEYPDFLVGAGTVLSTDLVRRAVDAGARFIVAPGFNPKVVDYCLNHRIPVIPG